MTKAHKRKLAAAIEWLRNRNKYCLETPLATRIYKPLHGTPLPPVKA